MLRREKCSAEEREIPEGIAAKEGVGEGRNGIAKHN
jgi:hypothetical protein